MKTERMRTTELPKKQKEDDNLKNVDVFKHLLDSIINIIHKFGWKGIWTDTIQFRVNFGWQI